MGQGQLARLVQANFSVTMRVVSTACDTDCAHANAGMGVGTPGWVPPEEVITRYVHCLTRLFRFAAGYSFYLMHLVGEWHR